MKVVAAVNVKIATPEFIEARKPIEKWFDLYDRGVITKSELIGNITDYALSFRPKEDDEGADFEVVEVPTGFSQSESSYRIHEAMKRLKTMPMSEKIDIMVSAKLMTPEQADRAKRKLTNAN